MAEEMLRTLPSDDIVKAHMQEFTKVTGLVFESKDRTRLIKEELGRIQGKIDAIVTEVKTMPVFTTYKNSGLSPGETKASGEEQEEGSRSTFEEEEKDDISAGPTIEAV